MPSIIDVQHLIKRYRKADKNAVDDITFSVETGDFFTLLGPNGAGKTTTISILTTTLAKTSGTIHVAGYDLDKHASQVRQSIGIIFQNPSLDLNLTAEENIRFHAFLYGLYPFVPFYQLMPQDYKQKVNQLTEVLGIQNEIFKPIKTFSGGMKRKLEIIRSLIHQPKVLILDEPTSGLDPLSRKNLWEYLTDVRIKQKITIFLTTHYLEEAEDSDQVCILDHGKIVTSGTPKQIKSRLIKDYLLLDSKFRPALFKELDKLKLTHLEQDNQIRVELHGQPAQQVISSIKTRLSSLQIHNPSLEDAYLEIIDSQQT